MPDDTRRLRLGRACAITILLGSAPAAAQPSYSHSPDERQLAWSAWIAGHDRIDAAQPMLERIVAERIDAFPSSPPVDYALDALIQFEAHLTPDLLARIVEQRPVACSRRAVPPATPRGCSPGSASARGSRYRTAARIARSAGMAMASGCGVAERHPGMPPWPSYRLTPDSQAGVVVLATGPTPVYYERRVTRAGTGPSRGGTYVDGPTGADRLRYVVALTGQTPALADDVDRGVRRHPGLDIAALSTQFRHDIERQHATLLRDLVGGGFLTPREADELPVEVEIEITVLDASAWCVPWTTGFRPEPEAEPALKGEARSATAPDAERGNR